MKTFLKKIGLFCLGAFGTDLQDLQTGHPLGRVFAFAWRGKIHIIGLESAARPVFLPQARLRYWKQELGFSKHPIPDYPALPREPYENDPNH